MKLYEDYCPRCPRPTVEGISNPQPDPGKCRYCSAKDFKEWVTAYVEAQRSIDRLKAEIERATKGVLYFGKKQNIWLDMIEANCEQGRIRVIKVGNQAVVLDWQDSSSLAISFAELEK